ncbi:MAG: MFS transporter, partial [Alphaproteobacteria bacterium]|nr:MFS transporter [Alphaproteobacteria bacterium]
MTRTYTAPNDVSPLHHLIALNQPRRTIAIGAVLTAMAIVVVDAGLSNIALPTMAASLHAAPAKAILVVTAYQVAVVMALLPCAALGERFGFRRVFTIGVALFTVASLASALSPSMSWLIAARFVQGLGGAAILALGVALLRFSVSDTHLGVAIGWNALTVALSAAAGPAIGAIIISQTSWHWLYAVSIPFGVGVLLATRALPSIEINRERLDFISIVLNCA